MDYRVRVVFMDPNLAQVLEFFETAFAAERFADEARHDAYWDAESLRMVVVEVACATHGWSCIIGDMCDPCWDKLKEDEIANLQDQIAELEAEAMSREIGHVLR